MRHIVAQRGEGPASPEEQIQAPPPSTVNQQVTLRVPVQATPTDANRTNSTPIDPT
jgi:hypothetical protein